MKKTLKTLAIILIFIFSLSFFGCGTVTVKGGPNKTDPVTSNGGLSVTKGDYLYFVNGYISNDDLKGNQNKYGRVTNGGIYRAKLENGKLMYETSQDEDGNEVKTLKDVELLVPKLAGFEYTSLYIFGDYIYFSTPNTEKDQSTGEIRFDLTDFYCVKLSGGDIYRLQNAVNISSVDNFKFTAIGNYVYLTYLSDGNIYNLKISGKNVQQTTKIAENVTSFAMYVEETSYTENLNEHAKYVYYTRSFKEDEKSITGNVLAKANLETNEETILRLDNNNTYTVKSAKNNRIYYTRTNSDVTNAYLYTRKLKNFVESTETQLTIVAYSSTLYILDDIDDFPQGVVVSEGDKLLLLTGIEDPETDMTILYDGSFTILFVRGEFIYGKDADGNIVKINYQTKTTETLIENNDNIQTTHFDYNSGYIYYILKYTNDNGDSYYLNRVFATATEKEVEFVGVLDKDDLPDEEEND